MSKPLDPLSPQNPSPSFSTPMKWGLAIAVVSAVAGVALVVFGSLNQLGPIGSPGFISSIAGGGALVLASGGGILWIFLASRKTAPKQQIPKLPPEQPTPTKPVAKPEQPQVTLPIQRTYGGEAWKKLNVEVVETIPNPPEIDWNQEHPLIPGKKLGEICRYIYVPKAILFDGKQLPPTIELIKEICEKNGYETHIGSHCQKLCISTIEPGCKLITIHNIPDSRKGYEEQQAMFEGTEYRMANSGEALLGKLLHCAVTKTIDKDATRCEEIMDKLPRGFAIVSLDVNKLLVWAAVPHLFGVMAVKKESSEPSSAPPQSLATGEYDLTPRDREVIQGLTADPKTISTQLTSIEPGFFEAKSQQRAKVVFQTAMHKVLGSKVYFPKACQIENLDSLEGTLDAAVFHVSTTFGVEIDIPKSSRDDERLHIYQVASQYNAAEAEWAFTPGVGLAMEKSKKDRTQGPLAQRTNPTAFELVIAFLTHLGFNILHKVLPSAGNTYTEKSPIQHGYLSPTDANIRQLIQEFTENYPMAEFVCYSSLQENWEGKNPVYLFLQAAPALGEMYAPYLHTNSDELQKHAALANFLALFQFGIDQAKQTGKPVVVHVNAPGGGVFENQISNLEWGLKKAGLALQAQMKEHKVYVQLEAFDKDRHKVMATIATNLKIKQDERMGDPKKKPTQ